MYLNNIIRKIVTFTLILIFSVTLFAQDSSNWYYGKKIRSIDFKGLENVTDVELSGVTSSFVGKPYSDALYFDLLNRVFALDLFDDISVEALPGDAKGDSVVIEFTVQERPAIVDISFEGNKKLKDSELKDDISIKEKDIYNASKILLDERVIRDAYLKEGFTNVRVSSRTEDVEDGIKIIFSITEGKATILKSVSFEGNQLAADKTLKGLLSMKEAAFFSKGFFQESELEADKLAILAYYQNRGYIDAAILDVIRTVAFNKEENCDELEITFVIHEGNQYTFNGIVFEGNTIFSTEYLRSLMPLQDGEIFNQAKFQSGVLAISELYYENGYASNYFQPDIQKNSETKQVYVDFKIVERPRSHVENIIIRGNTKTKDYVILRELPIETGDIFSKTKIVSGLRNLYNLQFFSSIVPDVVPGSQSNLVDLIINVEEQSTTALEFGVTFSGLADPDAMPISLFLKLQNSNVFGTGKSLAISTEVSTETQSLDFSFSDSWLFGFPVSVSVGAGLEHSAVTTLRSVYMPNGSVDNSNYYMKYNELSVNLNASIGRRWVPNFAILTLTGGISGEI